MKDPAVLFYIAEWLTATAGMDPDTRGWYLNLLLHNYDKGGLENDVETLAELAGVKHSKFKRFKQVLDQVLMQKFVINEETGLLQNPVAVQILKSREDFKEKRGRSGNIGVVIKSAKTIKGFTEKHINTLKAHLYELSDTEIEEHKDKQVLEQLLKLYINGNRSNSIQYTYTFIEEKFSKTFYQWLAHKKSKNQTYKNDESVKAAYNKLIKLSGNDPVAAEEIIKEAMANNYAGFFALTTRSETPKTKFEKLKESYDEAINPYAEQS